MCVCPTEHWNWDTWTGEEQEDGDGEEEEEEYNGEEYDAFHCEDDGFIVSRLVLLYLILFS